MRVQKDGNMANLIQLWWITYLHLKTIFEGAEKDGDSVPETNLPGILTLYWLIFIGKEYIEKSSSKILMRTVYNSFAFDIQHGSVCDLHNA